jgi:hypothetical protein
MTFSMSVNSKVLKNQVTGMKRSFFSFKETCQFMGHTKNLLLIDVKGPAVITCMIHDVNLTSFCLKKYPKKNNILRGRVDKIGNQVVCEEGDAVNLSMSCENNKHCNKPSKMICKKLKPVFAKQLSLSHHSKLSKNKETTINCYFAKKNNDLDLNLKL